MRHAQHCCDSVQHHCLRLMQRAQQHARDLTGATSWMPGWEHALQQEPPCANGACAHQLSSARGVTICSGLGYVPKQGRIAGLHSMRALVCQCVQHRYLSSLSTYPCNDSECMQVLNEPLHMPLAQVLMSLTAVELQGADCQRGVMWLGPLHALQPQRRLRLSC